ncbi:MAG: ribonuclease HI family protein [Candidatus Parcubacteria bacterium]|nr:ribonuclease HI family protein [Candidatus Parcubacteria bacterium]
MTKILKLFTDGGARGNPGPAAIGIVIKDEKDKILKKHAEYIGETTNNQAEYKALIKGLELAKDFKPAEVHCFLDSELVVKQLRQEYRVKDPGLQPLFIKAWNLSISLKKVKFSHIPRTQNEEADEILNQELDRRA